MLRRIASLLSLVVAVVAAASAGEPGSRHESSVVSAGDQPIHSVSGNQTAFSDLHNSVLYRLFTSANPGCLEDRRYPVNLQGLNALNSKLLYLSIGIPRFSLRQRETPGIEQVIAFLQFFRRECLERQSQLKYVGARSELATLLQRNQIPVTFALEGSHLLKGDVDLVDRLHAAGVRMIGIGHWFQNELLLDPGQPDDVSRGPRPLTERSRLSAKGRLLVHRMIGKKITLDLSHLGRAAFFEIVALNAKRTPLVASHSNSRYVRNLTRNLDDTQIRAIAASDGVIGISLHEPLLAAENQRATVVDVVDHIDHIRRLVGARHVAIGSDFEGGITTPAGLQRIEDIGLLREAMQERGFTDSEIAMIMWQNVLRILPE